MAVPVTLLPNPKVFFSTAAGAPAVNYKLYTYDAGTTNPRATYTAADGVTPNANPVILDARGEATIYWYGNYKVILKDASDVQVWSQDNVSSIQPGLGANVATIAALKALSVSTLTVGQIVFVQGYYATGDGGDGFFRYTTTNPGSDNGGTFIWSNTGGSYFVRQDLIGERYNVKWFGAKADGSDDYAAITACINAAVAANVSSISIPDGTYTLGTPLAILNNLQIYGQNKQLTILQANNADVFTVGADIREWALYDLTIKNSNGTPSAGAGIHQTAGVAGNVLLHRVNFKRCFDGFKADSGAFSINVAGFDCTFIETYGQGVNIIDGAGPAAFTWYATNWENSTGGALKMVGSYATQMKFVDCIIESQQAKFTLDVGANCFVQFIRGHFENNGGTSTGGADINIGGGTGVVIADGVTWSTPSAGATSFANIRIAAGSLISVFTKACYVSSYASNLAGFVEQPAGTLYRDEGSAFNGAPVSYDYLGLAFDPILDNTWLRNYNARSGKNQVITGVTTNSTPLAIWSPSMNGITFGAAHGTLAIRGWIVGTGTAGEYVRAEFGDVCSVVAGVATPRGPDSNLATIIRSSGALNAVFAIGGANLTMTVTGSSNSMTWIMSYSLLFAKTT